MHTLARETIEATDGRIVEERVDPRRAFAGHALTTPWDRPHLAYPHDYREIAGIQLPTRRRVFGRGPDGVPAPEPLIVTIDLDDVEFT